MTPSNITITSTIAKDSGSTWSLYYDTWNHDASHWIDAGTSLDKGRDMRSPEELRKTIEANPQYGLLLCDEKNGIIVMHVLKLEGEKIYGHYRNKITSPPAAMIITTRHFINRTVPSEIARITAPELADPILDETIVDDTDGDGNKKKPAKKQGKKSHRNQTRPGRRCPASSSSTLAISQKSSH